MNRRICLYNRPFPRIQSYYAMIDTAAEYGLSAVECLGQFEFETPDLQTAKQLREYADRKNIKFSCFSLYVNLAGTDAKEKIAWVKEYADVAAVLGAAYLHHTIVPEFMNPANVLPRGEELYQRGIEAVREVYDYAATRGVKTVYENQGYLFNGVQGFGRFLGDVGREVGVIADFGNIYQSPDGIEDFIRAFSDRICHVHLKDVTVTRDNAAGTGLPTLTGAYMNQVAIGTGSVDFKQCFDLLKKAGYQGYYSIEYGAPENDSPIIKEIIGLIDSWLA